MVTIEDRHEHPRLCGYRKPGELHLVSPGISLRCGKLPQPLICPTCNAGIKARRVWTWINPRALFTGKPCYTHDSHLRLTDCSHCPLGNAVWRAGLLWVGCNYYRRPKDFITECINQGVSRRIGRVPKGFELGITPVVLAHRKAIVNPNHAYTPGIFRYFVPTAIEYVVRDDDLPEKLERFAQQGVTLVRVHPIPESQCQEEQPSTSTNDQLETAIGPSFSAPEVSTTPSPAATFPVQSVPLRCA